MNKPGATQLYIKWIYLSIYFITFEAKLTLDIAVFSHLCLCEQHIVISYVDFIVSQLSYGLASLSSFVLVRTAHG